MNVVRALVSVYSLEILQVPRHVTFDSDAAIAVHVTGNARDVKRFTAIVALHH